MNPDNFSDQARKAIQFANQEAQRLNHEYIGTEHILIGLIREGTGAAGRVLKDFGLEIQQVRREVERIVGTGPDMITIGKFPRNPPAKKALEYAMEEAKKIGCDVAGTGHLLLGLLRDDECVAVQVLRNLDVDTEELRQAVLAEYDVRQTVETLPDPGSNLSEIELLRKEVAELRKEIAELREQVQRLMEQEL